MSDIENQSLNSQDYALLSEITIIIFTKNRSFFLDRQVQWWKNYPVKLLILDGSDVGEFDKYNSEKYVNVKYFKEIKFSHRMKIASENIETKYAAISGDDDLYLIQPMLDCIKFLELNHDFVSCLSQFLNFSAKRNKVYFEESYSESVAFEISDNNITDRVRKKISPYTVGAWYSVQRSNVLVNSLKLGVDWYDEKHIQKPKGLLEISIEISTAMQGKMSSINRVGYLRSNENFQINFIEKTDIDYEKWLGEDYDNERHIWFNNFFNVFKNKLTYLEIQNLLQMALNEFVSQITLNSDKNKALFFLKKVRQKIYKHLPFMCRRIILKHYILFQDYLIRKKNQIKIIYTFPSEKRIRLIKNNHINIGNKEIAEYELQDVAKYILNYK